MYLYIDETETDDYFIVVGLLMPSKETTNLSYKVFKNKISGYYIPSINKTKLFTEFKSTLTCSKYKFIRKRMLEEINANCIKIICSKFSKEKASMKEGLKLKVYLRLVSKIVENLYFFQHINICFDKLGPNTFVTTVIDKISSYHDIESVVAADSRLEPGIQFVDNVCGTIRQNLFNSNYEFYKIIENKVMFID